MTPPPRGSPVPNLMPEPYYDDGTVTIYHGDCGDLLDRLEYDVIVTDPPYGTGGYRRTEAGAGRDPRARLVTEAWDGGVLDWLRPVPTLVFMPVSRAKPLLDAASALGLTTHWGLFMRKRDPRPQPGGRTAFAVEPIWVLSSGSFLLYGGDDLIEASTPRLNRDADATGHPYQKPISVMQWLIGKLSRELVIVDPFMGSGSTLLAAKNLGRRAIGIEQDERWCQVARARLGQGVLDVA